MFVDDVEVVLLALHTYVQCKMFCGIYFMAWFTQAVTAAGGTVDVSEPFGSGKL